MTHVITPARERLLREIEASEITGMKVRTLQRWRMERRGPKWLRVGPKAVRYPEKALMEWIAGLSGTEAN